MIKSGRRKSDMEWHGQPCEVLIRAPYKSRVKRNCLIRLQNGEKKIVPCRGLRIGEKPSRQRRWQKKKSKEGMCPICGETCAPYYACPKHRVKKGKQPQDEKISQPCSNDHKWAEADPSEEEFAAGLGAQVCTRCGTRQLFDVNGKLFNADGTEYTVKRAQKRAARVCERRRAPGNGRPLKPDAQDNRQRRWQRKMVALGKCQICGIDCAPYRTCPKHSAR